MNSDGEHLVYSTEHGMLDKPMRKNSAKKKRQTGSHQQTPKKENKQGIRIQRESKGRGGKSVSVITGLQLNDAEMKLLLKRLKTNLGTGGAIKQGTIEIQGDQRQTLLLLLEKEGLKAKVSGG